MIAYEWEGSAPRSTGYGFSDDEDRARRSAEAWLRANPGGSVQLGMTSLVVRMLSPCWMSSAVLLVSRVLPDGSVTWEERPSAMAAAAAVGS